MKVRKTVITAAGWGNRFLPATKARPREMVPLLNRTIIQCAVEEAIASFPICEVCSLLAQRATRGIKTL